MRIRTREQLERKRARDREGQRLIRERNKDWIARVEERLDRLQKQCECITALFGEMGNLVQIKTASPVSTTSHAFYNQISPTSQTLSSSPGDRLQASTQEQVTSPNDNIAVHDLVSHQIIMSEETSPYQDCGQASSSAVPSQMPNSIGLSPTSPQIFPVSRETSSSGAYHVSERQRLEPVQTRNPLPVNKCLCGLDHPSLSGSDAGDECLENSMYRLLLEAHLAILVEYPARQQPRSPSVANLLFLDTDSSPAVRILGSFIRRSSLATLADTVASYFVMYRLLRVRLSNTLEFYAHSTMWRLYPTPENYHDMPAWYRPSDLQRTSPHLITIDFFPFPALRDELIQQVDQIDRIEFIEHVKESIMIDWPSNEQLFVKCPCDGSVVLNPKFEEHVLVYENWKMRSCWAQKQPRFAHLVNMSTES